MQQDVLIRPEALPAPEPFLAPPRRTWLPSPFASAEAAPVDVKSLKVEVVTDPERLAALEPQWQALADAAVEPNAFYEPWMVLPALRALEGRRPRFAFVWGRDAATNTAPVLCGVIPFVEREPGVRRTASLWVYRECALTTPLLRRGVPRETLSAFLGWLGGGSGVIRLPLFPGEGPVAQALIDAVRHQGWSTWQAEAYTRALFRPAPSAEAYLSTAVSARRRKDWRRLQARLVAAAGRVTVEELEEVDSLREWLAAFVRMEASGWKGREGVALAADVRAQTYFAELCRHALLRGRLQLLKLSAGGQPIAMKVNLFSEAGAGFAYKIAYDERWARFSPGVLLELETIHRLHAMTRVRWMDSCAAPDRFMINQLWPERRQLQTLFLGAPRLLSALTLAALPLLTWARGHARRVARRDGRRDPLPGEAA